MSDSVPQAPAVPAVEPGALLVIVRLLNSAPVANATVKIVNGPTSLSGATKPDGVAFLDAVPPGIYKLEVFAPGLGLAPEDGVKIQVGPVNGDVKVFQGPESTEVTVVLAAPGFAFLEVKVQDENLKPIPKVPVEIDGLAPGKKNTGGGGTVLFGPLAPQTVNIFAGQTDRKAKPHFSRVNQPPDAVIFKRVESKSILTEGMNHAVVQMVERKLEITKVDDHFAPSAENNEIVFAIKNLAKRKVVLTIEGENYAGKTIVQRDLTEAESADGESNKIAFTGKIEVGAAKDQFINPLMGPFTVRLEHVDADNLQVLKSEKKFKVLYHSLELKVGPWTPDEKEPDKAAKEKDWVAFKLNELGYWGGPVGKDTDDYLIKAVIQYKQRHKKMWREFFAVQTGNIVAELKDALAAGDNKRPFMTGSAVTDKSKESNLYVDVVTYEKLAAGGDELMTDKNSKEKDRLNRPLLPLEASIFLKNKAGAKTAAPEAVGECRVSFRVKDPIEDLSPQFPDTPDQPSKTKAYIEKALKLEQGRTGDNGDNCPANFNGLRKGPGQDFDQCWLLGDFYIPYVTAADAGQKVVFSKASNDKATFPKRQGKAGIFFRPSYIAGDSYTLSAEIDFTGLPNQAALEADHGCTDASKRIKAETGKFTIKRRAKIAVVVDWPVRKKNSPEFDKIVAEFAKAHIELDVSGVVHKKPSELFTSAEYVAAAKVDEDPVPDSGDPDDLSHLPLRVPADLALSDEKYFGHSVPGQGQADAGSYIQSLKEITYHGFATHNFHAIGALISKKVRAEHPDGFILTTFYLHDPVDIMVDPAKGPTLFKSKFVVNGASIGLPDSTILLDMQDNDQVYYVTAHEMGHNLFLHHYEHTPDHHPTEHDSHDHNCMMSYSIPNPKGLPAFQRTKTYTPHFCGKCNLRLRGWKVEDTAMPASS